MPHECPACGKQFIVGATLVADWLDRAAAIAQSTAAQGPECPACGRVVDFAAPLVQFRNGDVVDAVIGLPPGTDFDEDDQWIRAIADAFPEMKASPRIAPVRLQWWPFIASLPLGPIFAGVISIDDFVTSEEAEQWRRSLSHTLSVPNVVHAVNALAQAETSAAAIEVIHSHTALTHPDWYLAVREALTKLASLQPTEHAREHVLRRVDSLRSIRLFGDSIEGTIPNHAADLIGVASGYSRHHPQRVAAVRAAADALDEADETPALVSVLTSLVSSVYDGPGQTTSEVHEAVVIARRAAALSNRLLGAGHELTLRNELNALTMSIELLDTNLEQIVALYNEFVAFAAREEVRRTSHLADAITNLATLIHRRLDIPRAARSELQIEVLLTAERIAKLLTRSDARVRFVIATNLAASHRGRIAGVGVGNASSAAQVLSASRTLELEQLSPTDQVMRASTQLAVRWEMAKASPTEANLRELLLDARALRGAALALREDSETAINAITNSASIIGDVALRSQDSDWISSTEVSDAMESTELAVHRAEQHFGPHHRSHIGALLALAGLQSDWPGESDVAEQQESEAVSNYLRVIDLGAETAPMFVAIAANNLGRLHFRKARWREAAEALSTATAARRSLIAGAHAPDLALGEIADGEDSAARESLAWILADRPANAILAIERHKGTLLRRQLKVARDSHVPEVKAGTLIVYLTGSDWGTSLIVRASTGLRFARVYGIGQTQLLELGATLSRARSRPSRTAAIRQIEHIIAPVIEDLRRVMDDDDELAVVSTGSMSIVPLHVFVRPDSGTRRVRYFPSAIIADHLERRVRTGDEHAVIVLDPDGDLPLAEQESIALARHHDETRILRGANTRSTVLSSLQGASLIHLACHATMDPVDPMMSFFSLGGGQRLSLADLISAGQTQGLDLVVASACQSGAPGSWNPDELLAVAHGFLHAGARAVITTLWDVNDLPASALVCAFYHYLDREEHPALALALAQGWLRTLSAQSFDRPGSPELPNELRRTLKQYLARLDPLTAPFADELDWGSFIYVGP